MKDLDPAVCHAMLRARDTRFDGQFFVGVKTTGIYCRPVCPARTPRAASCSYFETAAQAEDGGFRPCLRCRPELAPARSLSREAGTELGAGAAFAACSQGEVALPHAIYRHLQERATSGQGLEILADEIGFSLRHLRRMMMDEFGVAPVKILQTERLLFAKKLLQETSLPVIEIAGISGFGSLRRMNRLFQSRYRLAPTGVRRASGDHAKGGETGVELRLGFRPPFAWRQMLSFLKARAIPGVEQVSLLPGSGLSSLIGSSYVRNVRIAGETGRLKICLDERPNSLRVSVSSSLSKHLFAILSRLRNLFDLDANPVVVESHLERDRRLRPLLKSVPGLRVPGAWDGFETAIRAVLGQQVSVAGASTLAGRLAKEFGDPLQSDCQGLDTMFPSAKTLASVPVRKISALGMPRSRAETIRMLASFASEGGLEGGPAESAKARVDAMLKLKGVGDWTASYVAMRVFRDPDAFPAGDLGLRKAANADAQTLLRRSQTWRPWRAYAAMYLWQSLNS